MYNICKSVCAQYTYYVLYIRHLVYSLYLHHKFILTRKGITVYIYTCRLLTTMRDKDLVHTMHVTYCLY